MLSYIPAEEVALDYMMEQTAAFNVPPITCPPGFSMTDRPKWFIAARYKTKMCKGMTQRGYCPYTYKCLFAHHFSELRFPVPILGKNSDKYKTKLCINPEHLGFCPYGPRCHFIHQWSEDNSPEIIWQQEAANHQPAQQFPTWNTGEHRNFSSSHSPGSSSPPTPQYHSNRSDVFSRESIFSRMEEDNVSIDLQKSPLLKGMLSFIME